MRKMISKAAVAAMAALSLGAAMVVPTEPATAGFRMGGGGFGGGFHGGMGGGGFGGWHGGTGGFGGWHGGTGGFGGWHGGTGAFGGWRGGTGGWRTAAWGGGWNRGWGGWRGGWGGCRWGGCGWGGGWWWPAGIATGVALAGTYPYWGDYGYGYGNGGYGYDNGCTQLVRVYSRRGHYLGRRWVNVC